jgi:hypothetical protein
MEICPATAVRNATTNACETKTITLKVLDANLAEVPTSVGLVKQTVNGVTSTSTRLRTAKALSPASTTNPVYLDWEASTNFNLDTLVCKLKDSSGNVLKTWEKVRQQSYAVNPNSTSTYSVTCNDGQ